MIASGHALSPGRQDVKNVEGPLHTRCESSVLVVLLGSRPPILLDRCVMHPLIPVRVSDLKAPSRSLDVYELANASIINTLQTN